ncbi:MAG: glycosyltransferase family 87 protein [Planctomycetota bacterium]
MIYASARQFATGGNPYDFNATFEAYEAAGGTDKANDQAVFAALYPPMTYAVLAPVGRLDWPHARLVWLVINLIATASITAWLIRHRPPLARGLADRSLGSRLFAQQATVWALAVWIGSAVLHTALAFGQLSVVTLALMLPLLSLPYSNQDVDQWPWMSRRTIGLGLLLTLAGALKPQLVVVITGFVLFTPRWRAVVWGMAGGLALIVFSIIRLQLAAPGWLGHWHDQLAFFAATGHADPTAENPFTYQMIHLEPWFHRLWPDGIGPRTLLRWLPIGMVAIIGGASVFLLYRHGSRRRTNSGPAGDAALVWTHRRVDFYLLAMSIAAVLTLLVGYHRTYDAVSLVIPGLWVWRRLNANSGQWTVYAGLVAISVFILPGPAALTVAARRDWLPTWLTEGWIWQALIVPHHTIALVVLLAVLVGAMLRHARDAPPA